jgi:hypothetical protein
MGIKRYKSLISEKETRLKLESVEVGESKI